MTNEKMTYATALTYAIENCEMPTEVKEKLMKLKEQTSKKSTAERKPTAKQEENAKVANAIVEYLKEADSPQTIGEIMKGCKAVEGFTNQRVSAIIRPLLGVRIERTEDKRKAYFSAISFMNEVELTVEVDFEE